MNQTIIDYFGEVTAEERKEILGKYKAVYPNNDAAVYCGTYGKYNGGSIAGMWISLEKCADTEELFAVCALLHWDEEDPEYMFQDYENFPRSMYHESMCFEDADTIFEWLELNESERDAVAEYWDEHDSGTEMSTIIDNILYHGDFDDFADEQADEMLDMYNVPDFIKYHFDYEGFRRDLRFDYVVTSNFVFAA